MTWAHLPAVVPLVYFLGALLLPMCGRAAASVRYGIVLVTALAGMVFSAFGLAAVTSQGTVYHHHLGGWPPPIGIELVLDPLSAFVAMVITGVAFVVLIYVRPVISREIPRSEMAFYSMAMLLLGGFLGIVLTGDLFNLYVFLEISSLASYALVAVGDKRAPVSAFRYLILGTVGASFYLLGVGFVLLETGSLNMRDVAAILKEGGASPSMTVGLILMVVGIAVKLALFPLHGWLPDAYTHACSPSTVLIAPIGTKVAAYALIRLLFFVMEPGENAMPGLLTIIGYLGVGGILWGSVMAVAQSDLKRMLAYSSVGQVGYIALGIGLASPLGVIGALLHLMNHACMKAALFLVTANFLDREGHHDIERLRGHLRFKMPWTSACLALGAMSMIGLPPTAGFFSKWYLFWGSIEASAWLFVAAIFLSSLLNAVYFFRVLERIYLRAETREPDAANAVVRSEVTPSMLIPTLTLGVGVLVLGVANVWVVEGVLIDVVDWNGMSGR